MDLEEIARGLPATKLAYMHDSYLRVTDAQVLRALTEKNHVYLVLDGTNFHPKGGGQPSDKGRISAGDAEIEVQKVMLHEGVVVHWGKVLRGVVTEGQTARCIISWDERYLLMRRHTAGHLLDHCLSVATGRRVETTESWLGDPCYVGYAGQTPTEAELDEVEALAKEFVLRGAPVHVEFHEAGEAQKFIMNAPNVRRLPSLREVRTVTIEGCDPIPCGGTHVRDTKEIGIVKVARAESLGSNRFRVYYGVD